MTLKTQLVTDLATGGVFFNTNDFAEPATYYPVGGIARLVQVVVDNQASFPEQAAGLVSQQALDVFVSRSATTGIDNPQLGDGLKLSTDAAGVGWSYQEKLEGDEHSFTLRFVRTVLEQVGGTRQQR